MKRLNTFTIGFIFTGCFLGAGFVSGQELWQFFGAFGMKGIAGMFCAAVMLGILGFLVMRLARLTGTGEMDRLIIMRENQILRGIFAFSEIFFLFGIFVVMVAGIGSLFNQVFGMPVFVSSLIFTVIVLLVAVTGADGLLTSFSVTVPLLAVMSLVIFVLSAKQNGIMKLDNAIQLNTNKLLGNWFLSSMIFVSYNFFAAIGVLAPLGNRIEKPKKLAAGVATGAFFIVIIAFSILFTVSASEDAVQSSLPMLKAAENLGTIFRYLFSFLLFAGMFGASLTSVFAITEYVKGKCANKNRASAVTVSVTCILALLCSLIVFNKLISTFYPVCGYLGFIAILLMIINCFKVFRREHTLT